MIARRLVAVAATAAAISLQGIKNFRSLRGAASTLPVYRCAALDGATPADVIALASIDGKRLGRVIDLRNDDEIGKGRANRTAAATDFYRSIRAEQLLINRPLLGDIDGFWAAVADQAPPLPVFPKIAMLWSSRPLDEALSRALEDGGLAMLYTCILASAPAEVGRAVDDVLARDPHDERGGAAQTRVGVAVERHVRVESLFVALRDRDCHLEVMIRLVPPLGPTVEATVHELLAVDPHL